MASRTPEQRVEEKLADWKRRNVPFNPGSQKDIDYLYAVTRGNIFELGFTKAWLLFYLEHTGRINRGTPKDVLENEVKRYY